MLLVSLMIVTAMMPAGDRWINAKLRSMDHKCSPGTLPRQNQYRVEVITRDPVPEGAALVSYANGTSDFTFNFATAWFPAPNSNESEGLIIRVVECNPNHHSCANTSHQEWTNAGALAVVPAQLSNKVIPPLSTGHVDENSISWAGARGPSPSNRSLWGAADPRVTYRAANQQYYLTWDNCTQNCYPQRKTLLSTTSNPHNPAGWKLHGEVFPFNYTSGASLLFRDDDSGAPHLAFVCNSNTAGEILLAESTDGIKWTVPRNVSKQVFMAGRQGCWDSKGVAAGPQPERLSTGDWLYIYNIDTGFPYHPNPFGRCAIGWAILDRQDPSVIVARSGGPLLTATLPWETCASQGKGYSCQEPRVVFSTGLKPLGGDEFYVLYGGADTDVGIARIAVHVDAPVNHTVNSSTQSTFSPGL